MDEREFELVNIIGAQLGSNQRDLSRAMELSLGMTNMLIRRLLAKGYIRIKQLNKKKVEYILTPKGFAEKMRKSVKYTLKTINSITLVKNRLLSLVKDVYDTGVRKFYVLGGDDLGGLIEMIMKENFPHDYELVRVNEWPKNTDAAAVLICRENVTVPQNGVRTVNVIEELAKDEILMGHNLAAEGVVHA
jgi:DNA-binding MarR family transcriptional regulator